MDRKIRFSDKFENEMVLLWGFAELEIKRRSFECILTEELQLLSRGRVDVSLGRTAVRSLCETKSFLPSSLLSLSSFSSSSASDAFSRTFTQPYFLVGEMDGWMDG